MKLLTINIKKPLYGNYVYINESTLKKAFAQGGKIQVTIPSGSAIIDPVEWKKNGKRMEKVFKIPGHPMVLWGGFVPVPASKGKILKEKVEENKQTKLF